MIQLSSFYQAENPLGQTLSQAVDTNSEEKGKFAERDKLFEITIMLLRSLHSHDKENAVWHEIFLFCANEHAYLTQNLYCLAM